MGRGPISRLWIARLGFDALHLRIVKRREGHLCLHELCGCIPLLQLFCEVVLNRHREDDWGKLDSDDQKLNQLAREQGEGRIMSNYPFPEELTSNFELPDDRLWIITYPGQDTTLLFPCEY